MPGRRAMFTAKGDRMARHIAAHYGGGRRGLSIGYATATKAGLRTKSGGGRRKRSTLARSRGRKGRR